MSVPRSVAYLTRVSALRYIPTALLLGVACTQIWLTHTTALSPWGGGGFGMFATTDADYNRHLHVYAMRSGMRQELSIPPSLRDRVQRTLMLPSDAALRTLARGMAATSTPDAGPPEAVLIRVWTTRFDPDTLAPSGVLLRSLEVPIEP